MKSNSKPNGAARTHLMKIGAVNANTNKPNPDRSVKTGVGISSKPKPSPGRKK